MKASEIHILRSEIVDIMEIKEILLFYYFKQAFQGRRGYTRQRIAGLENEFEIYIKEFRSLFERLGGSFSFPAFYEKVAGNGWLEIRRRMNKGVDVKEPDMRRKALRKKEQVLH